MKAKTDFLINDDHAFAILIPQTKKAFAIVRERFTHPETQFIMAHCPAIEHRYAFDIFMDLKSEGYTFAPL